MSIFLPCSLTDNTLALCNFFPKCVWSRPAATYKGENWEWEGRRGAATGQHITSPLCHLHVWILSKTKAGASRLPESIKVLSV